MTEDERLENVVSDALSKEPNYFLKANFADRVIAALQAKREAKRDRWAIIVGVVGMIVALTVVLQKVKFSAPNFFTGYTGLIIFGMLFAVGLHFVDKLLLSRRTKLRLDQ